MRVLSFALALCALVLAAESAELLGRTKRSSTSSDTSSATSCYLDIRTSFSITTPPLILVEGDDGWEMAGPTNRTSSKSFMDLSDKSIKLACPGDGNTLTQTSTSSAEATCSVSDGEAVFVIDEESYPVGEVTCTSRITPYEQATGNTCKGDGTEFTIGFIVDETMYGTITSCQRVTDGKTYYSQHVLNGHHFPEQGNGGSRKQSRPSFNSYNSILFNGFSPSAAYKQTNELQCLTDAMGDDASSVFNAKKSKFFSRGHLAPNADFILDTWRDITFTYLNAQPQWQEVNGGNWNNVEIYVRYHAAAIENTLNVITGATGNLAPTGNNVYLASQSRIPVPEFFVKLVQDPRTDECIGFVANNFDSTYSSTVTCSITCDDYGWANFTSTSTQGTVTCCTAEDIKTSFSEALPDDVYDCSGGVLTYQGSS